MANERKNEDIVWAHFVDDELLQKNPKGHSLATFEKQQSDNKRVQSILATASKNGSGNVGKPEGIVTFSEKEDFIIFWEGKASLSQHASADRVSDPKRKAVDGAIWFATKAVESGKFNVAVALATSGETEEELKVDYFLVKKQNGKITHAPLLNLSGEKVNVLISLKKTLEFVYPVSTEEQRKRDNKLRDHIHGLMRNASLSEESKPIVMAAALLALKSESFNYRKSHGESPEYLGEDAFKEIERFIKKEGLIKDSEDRKKFIEPFRVIQTHSQLHASPDNNVNNTYFRQILYSLAESRILDSLNPDIIADFYTEFLKYSGGDGKGLGIVLTPHHITDLFAKLGFITKNTVFIDTCFGTGSFLNSALHVALNDADSDEERKAILKNNVVGIELSPKMYTLGATNLLLRGANIDKLFEGDSFDPVIEESIRDLDYPPSVCLINPPYALKKNGGKSEIEFLEQACNLLTKDGFVVALVPVSTGSETKAFSRAVKERILSKHSLYAVMSMPPELFMGKAGTVVQILVFKTGTPHTKDSLTWFADWSDDGFILKRHVGRDDYKGLWSSRKQEWLEDYTSRIEKIGSSLLRHVDSSQEWATEAYLETDYTKITVKDFEDKIKDFVLYSLSNDLNLDSRLAEEGLNDA